MWKMIRSKALNWAHRYISRWQKASEACLKDMESFSEQDMQDELLNGWRYALSGYRVAPWCGLVGGIGHHPGARPGCSELGIGCTLHVVLVGCFGGGDPIDEPDDCPLVYHNP